MYEVRASDAHSWAEVYFPGIGWQGFDPTATVPLYDGRDTVRAGSGLLKYLAGKFEALPTGMGQILRMVGFGLVLLIVGALTMRWQAERRLRRRRSWADSTLAAFEEIGRRRGIVRAPSKTPLEYLESLELAGMTGARQAGELITSAAYSAGQPGTGEVEQVHSLIDAHRTRKPR
ncbi:MAG: transglutaminase family protein, partial [Acidimicrobiia bacterium]|nr:transglutaminase family protein [Acidimicrobiia bacterium]